MSRSVIIGITLIVVVAGGFFWYRSSSTYGVYSNAVVVCESDTAQGAKLIQLADRRFGKDNQPKDLRFDISMCSSRAATDRLIKLY